MKPSHLTAIGLAIGGIAMQLQAAGTWAAVFTPSSLASIGLQISALCIALGSASVFAPVPTKLDSLKAIVSSIEPKP